MFREQALGFLERATAGRYRAHSGVREAAEFTAIYPAGTTDATTTYKGERLPEFGVTGVWPLIRRAEGQGITGMVDYLSPNPGYGFITMLPYEHAGGIAYNAFHNAGVRCSLGETAFLPSAWRKVMGERDEKKPYQNLWIVGRGPTSHGCMRLGSGHMSEMRQIVPSESNVLERVVTFRSLPQCYDVFDITWLSSLPYALMRGNASAYSRVSAMPFFLNLYFRMSRVLSNALCTSTSCSDA